MVRQYCFGFNSCTFHWNLSSNEIKKSQEQHLCCFDKGVVIATRRGGGG